MSATQTGEELPVATLHPADVGSCHYPGDVVAALLADPIKGPDSIGELVTVYAAEYDPATDRTTARFRYTTTADLDSLKDAR